VESLPDDGVDLLADDGARASLRRAKAEDEAGQAEILTYEQARERSGPGDAAGLGRLAV
jgi:hypothetical protein